MLVLNIMNFPIGEFLYDSVCDFFVRMGMLGNEIITEWMYLEWCFRMKNDYFLLRRRKWRAEMEQTSNTRDATEKELKDIIGKMEHQHEKDLQAAKEDLQNS